MKFFHLSPENSQPFDSPFRLSHFGVNGETLPVRPEGKKGGSSGRVAVTNRNNGNGRIAQFL
jgi:hypothetical protein